MPHGAIPFPFGDCRICKDRATGIHYGVNTCEGCKGFFKRSLPKGDKYKCFFGSNCVIEPQNRNRCKACRFQRCLQEGMSILAVKMGRIPNVEREKALMTLPTSDCVFPPATSTRGSSEDKESIQQCYRFDETLNPTYQSESNSLIPTTSGKNDYFRQLMNCKQKWPSLMSSNSSTGVKVPNKMESVYHVPMRYTTQAEFGTSRGTNVDLECDNGRTAHPNYLSNPPHPNFAQLHNDSGLNTTNSNTSKGYYYSSGIIQVLVDQVINATYDKPELSRTLLKKLKTICCGSAGCTCGLPTNESILQWIASTDDVATRESCMHSITSTLRALSHEELKANNSDKQPISSLEKIILPQSLTEENGKNMVFTTDLSEVQYMKTPKSQDGDMSVAYQTPHTSFCSEPIHDEHSQCVHSNLNNDTEIMINASKNSDMLLDISSTESRHCASNEVQDKAVVNQYRTRQEPTHFSNSFHIQKTLREMTKIMKYIYDHNCERRDKMKAHKDKTVELIIPDEDDTEALWKALFDSIPKNNAKILNFCHALPGFIELCPEDKRNLIQQSYYDIWMLTNAEFLYDGESHMILPNNMIYTRYFMEKFLTDQIVKPMFEFAERLQFYNLTDLEIAILCAVQLINADNVQLKNRQKVKDLNCHYLDVLAEQVMVSHSDGTRLLIDIFRLIPALVSLSDKMKNVIGNFSPDDIPVSSV